MFGEFPKMSHDSCLLRISFEISSSFLNLFLEAIEGHVLALSYFESSTKPSQWVFEILLDEKEIALSSFQEILQDITNTYALSPLLLKTEPVYEKNWVLETYRIFPPIHIGRFFIHGSHIQEPSPTDLLPIQINAATAFGSGEHPTTQGCLLLLTKLWSQKMLPQTSSLSFLDVGTGSGILAFAIASLFKGSVVALDNDPESVRVTQENAVLNKLSHKIDAQVSEGFEVLKTKNHSPFTLIMANILKGPLLKLASDMASYTEDKGYIILSGLLSSQAPEIIQKYEEEGFRFQKAYEDKGWTALLLQKNI